MSAVDARPRRRGDVVAAPAGDEGVFLLHPERGEYFALDEVGRFVWEHCDGGHTVAELVDVVVAEFDADRAEVAADLDELLTTLAAEGLLEPAR